MNFLCDGKDLKEKDFTESLMLAFTPDIVAEIACRLIMKISLDNLQENREGIYRTDHDFTSQLYNSRDL